MAELKLRTIMDDLDYPETGAVLDRETIQRVDDLQTAIQTFRGLNHLRARPGDFGLSAQAISNEISGQLWQTVYLALRLFDHAYPGAAKTPHERFGPVASRTDTLEAAVALEEALEDNDAETIAAAARTLLNVLDGR